MRERFGTQPFLVEKRRSPDCRLNEVFLLPRWATRSPPHQSPSVTASPQGEAFAGGMPLQQNAFAPNPCSRKMRIQIRVRRWAPKQPLYRNNAPPNPKTSEWERAGHKTGGPGGLPPALFLPISREKWGPRRAGGPPGRCAPRHRKSRDHSKGTQYPTAPPPGTGREPTSQDPPCAGPNQDHLPTAKPPTPVEISTFLSGVPRFTIWT